MDLEFQQLDLRYESLRVRSATRERKLLASVAEVGQLIPITVVRSEPEKPVTYIVVEGFARVRVLRQLHHDTVRAVQWDLSEVEALLLDASLRSSSAGQTILEQAWLLDEMHRRFGFDQEELANRFDRSRSWVCRRLALVRELPDSIQEEIRRGRIVPHAAAKYLVPMARANREHCKKLARAIARDELTSRDVGELYACWRDGDAASRERLIADPSLFLRVRRSLAEPADQKALGAREALLKEVAIIGSAARRARERMRSGASHELTGLDHEDIVKGLHLAFSEIRKTVEAVRVSQKQGEDDARSKRANDDPRVASTRTLDSSDRANGTGVAQRRS